MTAQLTFDTDVAIIGAGPVGMALACELIRHGLRVRIFDKSPTTKDYSRAPVFWPRAQEALDLMGLHSLWNGRTTALRRMNVNIYGEPAGVVDLDGCESAHPVPMMVGQDVTEKILARRLAELGCEVTRSSEALDVALRSDGVTLTVRHADGGIESFDASWIVGCDGTQSLVREKTGIEWIGHRLNGLMVSVTDTTARWALPQGDGDAYVALTEHGYLLAIPMPECWRVIVATPDVPGPHRQTSTTLPEVARLTADALGGPVEFSDASWVAVVRYGNYIARDFRRGRALLAGDAAHSIAPLSGQGMNIGIQDAMDLGWKLSYVHKGWAADTLLDSYNEDRRPVAQRLEQSTNRFFRRVLKSDKWRRHLARTAAPLALKSEKLRERIAGFYTGTDIHYSDSPLSDCHRGRHPQPGEHVRDGELIRWPRLEPMRLLDALRGRHWTVMLFSGASVDADSLNQRCAQLEHLSDLTGADRLRTLLVVGAPSAPALRACEGITIALDAWRSVHKKYAAGRGALVLVRPDGYVALHRASHAVDFEALHALVERILGSPVTNASNEFAAGNIS